MSDDALTPEEIKLARSIITGISAKEWRALKAIAAGVVLAMNPSAGAGPTAAVASAEQLDGPYGNPKVRKDPKRWAGDSYVDARFSDCPTDYLLRLASLLEWKAEKDSKKPDAKKHRSGKFYWEFDRGDAALARGWAARNRGIDKPPPAPVPDGEFEDPSVDGESSDGDQGAGEDWVP